MWTRTLYGSVGNSITLRRVYSMVVLTDEVKTGGSNVYVPVRRSASVGSTATATPDVTLALPSLTVTTNWSASWPPGELSASTRAFTDGVYVKDPFAPTVSVPYFVPVVAEWV